MDRKRRKMGQLLIVNGNVNRETSRTNRLTKVLTGLLEATGQYDSVAELILENEPLKALNSARLNRRAELIGRKEYGDEIFRYARQFREADCIVIAAPYWDFVFPALMRIYIEDVSVVGLTYYYGTDCRPHGLCRAGKLYYVTTSGGYVGPCNYGYDVVKSMAGMFGIEDTECVIAEGLDIDTNDVEAILERTAGELRERLQRAADV